jgi:hypothetical protein
VVDTSEVTRSGNEGRALETAQRERYRATAWRVGAALTAGFGLLSVAVALVVTWLVSPGAFGSLMMMGLAAVPLIVAALAWRRANRHHAARDEALDQAWSIAVREVLEQRAQEPTASDLGRIMHLSVAETELLLARLDVEDVVRSRVTDAGEIVYSTGAPTAKLRISGEGREATAEAEADLEATGGDASAISRSSPQRDP